VTETLRVAWSGLSANKLRSGLTILGLTIGVGSVIVLIAVGTGSSNSVQSSIESLGSNVLLVSSTPSLGGLRGGGSSSDSLTMDDAAALVNHFTAPDVQSASPVVNASDVTLTYDGSTYSPSSFVGTTPRYEAAENDSMASGSSLMLEYERSGGRGFAGGAGFGKPDLQLSTGRAAPCLSAGVAGADESGELARQFRDDGRVGVLLDTRNDRGVSRRQPCRRLHE